MGKVASIMKRPFINFNLESRAEKVISMKKPIPAPKYEIYQMELDRMKKEKPEEFQETLKKDVLLDKNLRDIYVTSERVPLKDDPAKEKKTLPLDRKSYEEPVFGIFEPEKVTEGKITLKTALQFITNSYANPSKYNASYIARKYRIPEETVRNILKYCRTFQIYIPKDIKNNVNFAGPSIQAMKVTVKPLNRIEGAKEDKEK